jgi:SAM-dependent methyltransferase
LSVRAHKPPGFEPALADEFGDPSVVEAYRHRPAYAERVFDLLADLAGGGRVLDLGTGTGEIAGPLAARVERIDALDRSAAMIDAARRRGHPANIRWICGRAEEVALDPPYALATAGESIAWMDWELLLPRLAQALAPEGRLALVVQRRRPAPWDQAVERAWARASTRPPPVHFDPVLALEEAGLFSLTGYEDTAPICLRRTIDQMVGWQHALNGCSADRLEPARLRAFDDEIRLALEPYLIGGTIEVEVSALVAWGIAGRR